MNKAMIFIILFAFAAFLLPGCPQEADSDYVAPGIEESQSGGSYTAAIIKEWRLLSILFVLLSVGLIALCYPVANAFNIPELKAWADVELSEAFTTVIIVIVVMVVLVFVELVTHGLLLGSPDFDCGTSTYCPVHVAEQYLGDYLEKSLAVFGDLMESSIMAGKLATMSVVFGTNYLWLLYASFSMKVAPEYMIDVTTLTQQMQFLMGMREALLYQQFILHHVSGILAPAALLIGIVFRSFFVTRKLGGLLMAFGIGFLLVFPSSYAVAFYTLQTTLYGSSTTGGDVSNEFCTVSCMRNPPLAYKDGTETSYTRSNVTALFPQERGETDDEYRERIDVFLAGEVCTTEEETTYLDGEGNECDPDDDEEDCVAQTENVETCVEEDDHEWFSDVADATIVSCGAVSYKDCPLICRSLPYPNTNPECAGRFTEYTCREIVRHQCFITRYADMDDPGLKGLLDEDSGAGDACPAKCRPMAGLKKTNCDIGYGFKYTGEEMTVEDIHDQMDEMDYSEDPEVYDRCENKYESAIGEIYADIFCEDDDNAERALLFLGFEDLKDGGTVAWDEACPNMCRWVTTGGTLGMGCDQFCTKEPSDPDVKLTAARAAMEHDPPDIEAAIEAAQGSCYTIIPSGALTDPECTGCSYLMDPGFASYPPVHQRCDTLCGRAKMVGVSKDSGRSEAIEGFDGPAEMKAITKLVVPAIILPLLSLVITFMFIRTLSPILGGDVDIPGMTGLIK